jgi:hypothetical protein
MVSVIVSTDHNVNILCSCHALKLHREPRTGPATVNQDFPALVLKKKGIPLTDPYCGKSIKPRFSPHFLTSQASDGTG